MGEKSQSELAKEACEIEVDLLKAPIGFQDQYGSALGGIKKISFNNKRDIKIENINLKTSSIQRLNQNTILFYIGNKRSASKILKKQAEDTLKKEETKRSLIEMKNLADQLANEIVINVDAVGDYLHQNWLLKRMLTQGITSDNIDEIYHIGRENGALGGKLLGAGAGGSMLFYCPIEKQKSLIKSLYKLDHIDFKIDEEGTSIMRI
jgi:D-glycero-alpha-D-manno-heptose-7-phosphate kinase